MSERFIKYIVNKEKNSWLRRNHPNAFLLLTLIAERLKWNENEFNGIEIGDACIGDYREAGIDTRKKYRIAVKVLEDLGIIKIKKSSTSNFGKGHDECKKGAMMKAMIKSPKGTVVSLLGSEFYDIIPRVKIYENVNDKGHDEMQKRAMTIYIDKEEKIKKNKEIYHPQTPSFKVVEKTKKDLIDSIDFFGIRISKKELEDLKLLASESDLQICINELKANFSGQKILSWYALIKKHLERNKHKFVQKNREKNCQTVNQFYEKNKQKIENKAKIRMSEDKKFAIICCDHRTEEVFLGESPAIFTTQLECCFRKLDLWTSEPEKSFKEVNSIDFNVQNSLFSNFNLSVLSKKQKDDPTYQPNIFNSTQDVYGGFRKNL